MKKRIYVKTFERHVEHTARLMFNIAKRKRVWRIIGNKLNIYDCFCLTFRHM